MEAHEFRISLILEFQDKFFFFVSMILLLQQQEFSPCALITNLHLATQTPTTTKTKMLGILQPAASLSQLQQLP
jgi:hypothetical protein